MTENVRVFLAIELPDQAKSALASLVEQLKRAQVRGLRPVSPEGIHLTLRFLGEVPKGQIESIVTAVSRVAIEHRPFSLRLRGVGVFPGSSQARVLWVGVEGDLASLLRLHQGIEGVLEELGFARERRELSPHLTVARIRERTPSVERRQAGEALFSAGFEPGLDIGAECISLMRSTLLPHGARYNRLAVMPLAGNTPGRVPRRV